MPSDAEVLDSIAEILREPEWYPGSDFLDAIATEVSRVRDIKTRFCQNPGCEREISQDNGGRFDPDLCYEHNTEGSTT